MEPLFDHDLIVRRRKRLFAGGSAPTFLLAAAVDDLAERLAAVRRQFPIAVDLATPTAMLARALATNPQIDRVLRLEPGGDSEAPQSASPAWTITASAELLPLAAASVDLIASALALQWANDLPGIFAQARTALRPDGLLMIALLGGDTLHELRFALAAAEGEIRGGAAPRVAPFASLNDLGTLLQRAGFALPVVDRDQLVVRYGSAFELMADLRAMGCANALMARDRRPLTREIIARAAAIYAEHFSDGDGRVRATFDIISLAGWAPHDSQQRPLRPGSAIASLAAALTPKKS